MLFFSWRSPRAPEVILTLYHTTQPYGEFCQGSKIYYLQTLKNPVGLRPEEASSIFIALKQEKIRFLILSISRLAHELTKRNTSKYPKVRIWSLESKSELLSIILLAMKKPTKNSLLLRR